MRDWTNKRYWLIGASAGLGRALAHRLSRVGCEVILSARSEDDLTALAQELPGRATAVPLDVQNREEVEARAAEIGRIDGMVYLAGVYWPMAAQQWNGAQVEKMLDINLGGAFRSVGAVLPQFLERGEGHIVLTGSLVGYRGLPNCIGYGSSKAGVMYLGEALRADLKGTGIEVQIANPGFIKTRLTDKNEFEMPMIMQPDDAAQEMLELMSGDAFVKNFPGLMGLAFRGSQLLPNFAYYGLFKSKG